MESCTLQWPGLWDLPTYIIDSETNKVYGKDHPLPPHKQYLNNISKRYVKLSSVLELFSSDIRDEAEWTLRNLQHGYDVGSVVHSTVSRSKTASEGGGVERKVTTYIPTVAVMAFAIIWPCCKAFQTMRRAVLNHLDNYSESVCLDCGYVHRDCSCTHQDRHSTTTSLTFLGHAAAYKDCAVQTDPMVVMGMPPKLSQPGISVLLPQSIQLPAGVSGNFRIPVSLPQTSDANIDTNNWASGFFNLPPTLTLGSGCQPTLINPMLPSGDYPLADLQNSLAGGLALRPPTEWSMASPGQSLLSTPSLSYIRPVTTPSSSSVIYRISADIQDANSNRKRKLEGEPTPVAHAGVQTLAKSFTKKMKLRMGKLAADEASKISAADVSLNADKQASSVGGEVSLSDGMSTDRPAQAVLLSAGEEATNVDKSLHMVDTCKKEDSVSEKKCVTVWRLIEDDSDEEMPAATGSEGSSALKFDTSLPPAVSAEVDGAENMNGNIVDDVKTKAECSESNVPLSSLPLPVCSLVDEIATKTEPVAVNNDAAEKEMDSLMIDLGDSEMSSENITEKGWGKVNGIDNSMRTEGTGDAKSIAVANVPVHSVSSKMTVVNGPTDEMDFLKSVIVTVPSSELDGSTLRKTISVMSGNVTAVTSVVSTASHEVTSACNSCVSVAPGTLTPELHTDMLVEDSSVNSSANLSLNTEKTEHDADTSLSQSTSHVENDDQLALIDKKVKKIYGKFEYTPTGEHVLRCLVPKCSQTFDTKMSAELHNRVHPGYGCNNDADNVTFFQCHQCEFQAPFYHWYDLLRHMRYKHNICLEDRKASFTCEYCGLGFDTEDRLVSHIDFHYSNRYKCIYCGLLLLTWSQVQRHLDGCPEKSKQHRGGGMNLGCPFCTFVFHKKNIRNLHLLSHVDTGLSCALCDDGVIWNDWKTLRKHYQQKHAKMMLEKISPFGHDLPNRQPPLRCSRAGCDVTFKTMALYSNHMCRAHDLVPYTLIECIQCERKFRTEKSHEWHVRHMHGEERLCDKCDFVASSKAMLKLHISQKHQEKQHTCSECDKSFLYFHQLRVHMAHHARRSIYPCRRCDQEFSRLADLRQHLRQDHKQSASTVAASAEAAEEKTPGHDCPECDFRAPTRAQVIQHVKRTHPELTDGVTQPEDDDPDHSYFNRKVELPPKPPSPSPPPAPIVHHQPRYRVITRRGRRRRVYALSSEPCRPERLSAYGDRRERRRQIRVEKEQEERMKRLRKWTCARSRSIEEHRMMARGTSLSESHCLPPEPDDGTDACGITDSGPPLLPAYPYLDHAYFREEAVDSAERLQALWKSGIGRSTAPRTVGGYPNPPEVSAFQECETMLLGLSPPARGMVSRGRPRGRGRGSGRGGYVTEHRTNVTNEVSEDLEQLDPAIRDLDLLAESELLLRPGGDYSILQDILGPNCVSTARTPIGSGAIQAITSPMKSIGGHRILADSPRVKGSNVLSDSLPLDETAPSDLDDIELCEDDYRLFDPRMDQSRASFDSSTAPVVSSWRNPTVSLPVHDSFITVSSTIQQSRLAGFHAPISSVLQQSRLHGSMMNDTVSVSSTYHQSRLSELMPHVGGMLHESRLNVSDAPPNDTLPVSVGADNDVDTDTASDIDDADLQDASDI